MSKVVGVKSFATEITKSLQDWTQDVQYEVVIATDEKAKKLIKFLKADSPKLTKNYSKGWRSRRETNNRTYYARKIHNKTDYQLTHLLENGHGKGHNQKQEVKAIKHIEPNYEAIEREYEQAIIDAINGSKRGGGGYRSANSKNLIHGSGSE